MPRISFLKLVKALLSVILFFIAGNICFAQESSRKILDQPIMVNGDEVEYSTDQKAVIARGNVFVIYKGTKMSCQKMSVDMQTKVATAEGNVKIEDEKGILIGEKIIYNFETKTGSIINAYFQADPYYGKAKQVNKVSDTQFMAYRGYVTTCNMDNPQYRIKSKKTTMFPKDKIQTQEDTLYIGKWPIISLPRYCHSFTDPMMHVQLTPGTSKDWGTYMLSGWRYNLTDYLNGRIYLDYRSRLGIAEGFGMNYNTEYFGKGDFKYYYAHENDETIDENQPNEFQRYLIRLRHKWAVSERTDFISEYYKITDSKRILLGADYNLLKDYFKREYEKDSQPLSYALLHHYFNYSSLDVLVQKRTNRWYSQLEKLPEIKYSLPSYQLWELPLYVENSSSMANYNYKNAVPSDSSNDVYMSRVDTTNKVSVPLRLAFINVTPFVGSRETFYNKDVNNSSAWDSPRTIFMTGADVGTKFYRLFPVYSNFMGMDINALRHIITPTISYAYNHDPTIGAARLKQIDTVDNLEGSNAATLELVNTLQTKRNNKTVDFATLKIDTPFYFSDTSTVPEGFGNTTFDFTFLPYSRVRFDADGIYERKGQYFSEANCDINFQIAQGRSIGFGQRYQRKGESQLTFNLDWKLTPKWKLGLYERYQFKDISTSDKGFIKQEYRFTRDLHCWTLELGYTIEKNKNHTIWFIFTLKAFPELEFQFDQSFHERQAGAQQSD